MKIRKLITGTLVAISLTGTALAGTINLTITSPIVLSETRDNVSKVAQFYHEQDARALLEMIQADEAVLLKPGTVIAVNVSDYRNGAYAVHVKGKAQTLFLDNEGLETSTDFETVTKDN